MAVPEAVHDLLHPSPAAVSGIGTEEAGESALRRALRLRMRWAALSRDRDGEDAGGAEKGAPPGR